MSLKKIFQNDIETEYFLLIDKILNEFSDHSHINRARVINWIKQFNSKKRKICTKIIDFLSYYSASCLNGMTNQLISIIKDTYPQYKLKEIAFVPIGGAGSGSQLIARIIRSVSGIPSKNIINLHELTQTEIKKNLKAIVFIDDFSGSGDTIKDWWFNNEPIILPLGLDFIFGILVLNYIADEVINKFNPNIHFIEYLERDKNVFGNECNFFSAEEKEDLLKTCKLTKCSQTYLKGYGECGLLVAFQHGCPNDSLPILWHSSKNWTNLFKRRTV